MNSGESFTLEDVARLAGVSRTSASRVFLGQGKVSEVTRRKVRAAAAELGYVPNTYASNLASGSSDMVGLLLRDAANPAYGLLFTELQLAAAEHRLNMVSKTITADPQGAKQIAALDLLLGLRVSGLIVATGSLPSEQLAPYASRLPIIRAGRPEPGREIHAISYDERHAGQTLAGHIAELGHQAVAVLQTEARLSYPEWVRASSSTERLRELGVQVEVLKIDQQDDGVARAIELARRQQVSAVLCPSDIRALEVLRAARRAGLVVPDDLGVTGCDGIMPGLDLIGLTSYRVAVPQLAQRTIAALLALLGGQQGLIQELIPGTLVPGATLSRRKP